MDKARIAALRVLEKKATPGPWSADDPRGWAPGEVCVPGSREPVIETWSEHAEADAELIAETRNALPDLLTVAEQHGALVAALRRIEQLDPTVSLGDARVIARSTLDAAPQGGGE